MTDHPDIVERLSGFIRDDYVPPRPKTALIMQEAAAEITRLRAEAEQLRSVMIAAAEEIQAHWPAHCDAEGYGPANLMRRLEEGIPSQYAYTAGDFERLRAEAEALRKDAERYRWLRDRHDAMTAMYCAHALGLDLSRKFVKTPEEFDVVLDAAIAATTESETKEQQA